MRLNFPRTNTLANDPLRHAPCYNNGNFTRPSTVRTPEPLLFKSHDSHVPIKHPTQPKSELNVLNAVQNEMLSDYVVLFACLRAVQLIHCLIITSSVQGYMWVKKLGEDCNCE